MGFTRRAFIAGSAMASTMLTRGRGAAAGAQSQPRFVYPMGAPGQPFGQGCYVRTGYACENVRYYPGLWHTGENWFVNGDATAGHDVFAAGAGKVVYADDNYPGRVVIVQHASDLYSMYGHLDWNLAVAVGDHVKMGQRLGTVLERTDDVARSHLHFEFRTFLSKADVNGDTPLYGFTCGYECPPGPGYWPMNVPEHPSQVGWRNSTHLIGERAFSGSLAGIDAVVNALPSSPAAQVWSKPADHAQAVKLKDLALTPGDRFPLLAISAGAEDATITSSEGYRLWYEIRLPDRARGWVQAAKGSDLETGSDGRPASVLYDFLPSPLTGQPG